MTYALTVIKTKRGDFEVHRGGCRDIARSHSPRYAEERIPPTFEGETILDAIKASDVDSFGWFGQTPYQPNEDDRPWAVGHGFDWAPCFREDVTAAGITFNPDTFEPTVKAPEPAPTGVLVLRSLTVSKEEAALLRVAVSALLTYPQDLLSPEGRALTAGLAERTQQLVDSFPA